MWTICYKGWYIHGYCDKSKCYVINEGLSTRTFTERKSLHAAKLYITKTLKEVTK